jgi:tetratricopeptide (TPR) repeat protein
MKFIFLLLAFLVVVNFSAQTVITEAGIQNFKGHDTEKVKLLNQLAGTLFLSNPAQAQKFAEEALTLSEKNNFQSGISNARMNLGRCCCSRSQFDSALELYRNALTVCEKSNDAEGIANCYQLLSTASSRKGDHQNALYLSLIGLDLATKLGDKKRLSLANYNLGLIYLKKGDTLKAEQHLATARSIDQKLKTEPVELFPEIINAPKENPGGNNFIFFGAAAIILIALAVIIRKQRKKE